MRASSLIAAMLTAAALSGCSRNVLFTNPQQRVLQPDTNVVSIIYDRYGDLYPSGSVSVPAAALRSNNLQLAPYFENQRLSHTPVWDALLADAGVAPINPAVPFSTAWEAVQNGLRARAVRELDRQTYRNGGSRRTLIVLVHGFNNSFDEARGWFKLAKDSVAARDSTAVFLNVHWDGLTAPVPPGIWGSAQYNFPLVGLEFRRVLNALDSLIPVRILTHSSGGPLIASTLWNASAPLPARDGPYQRYRALVTATEGLYRPPHPHSLRVGMIAPAASTHTFDSVDVARPGPERLILGLNSRDYATGKVFLACTAFGSSCLATQLKEFCTRVTPIFEKTNTRLYAFDFSRASHRHPWLLWENHAMVAYLQRDDISRFLDLLLGGNDVSDPGEAPEFCPRFATVPVPSGAPGPSGPP